MEEKTKILNKATRWLFILSLPLLLLTASIAGVANSAWFYRYGFDRFNVGETTGLSNTELAKAASGIIDYFNSSEENIDITVIKDGRPFELFKPKEVAHFVDVKGLIRLDYGVFLGSFLFALGYAVFSIIRHKRREFSRAAIKGSGITVGLILAIGLAAVINFDQFFLWFHLISFANELWQLDPSQDYLIMLFPRDFWFSAALFIAGGAIAGAAVIGAGAILYLRKARTN